MHTRRSQRGQTGHPGRPNRRLLTSALASLVLLAGTGGAASAEALPLRPSAQDSTVASVPTAQAQAVEPTPTTPEPAVGFMPTAQARADGFTKLLAKADSTGQVASIVGLAVPFSPEGGLPDKAAAASQRAQIATAQAQLETTLGARKLKVKRKFATIPYVATMLDATTLRALKADPRIATVSEDSVSRPDLDSTSSIIGTNVAHSLSFSTAAPYRGAGQTVAVLDTGVDNDHPFLHVVAEACFSTESSVTDSLCANDAPSQIGPGAGDNCATSIDGCDHGTHVAGIATGRGNSPNDSVFDDPGLPNYSGVAPAANVIAIQAASRFDGATCTDAGDSSPCVRFTDSDIIAGLEHVFSLRNSHQIAAVNLSLGGGKYSNITTCRNDHPGTAAAVLNLVSANIATVAASGNSSHLDGIGHPACLPRVVSVGNTRDNDTVNDTSNSAPFLDLLAPGTSVTSSVPGGYDSKTGTSMAAPQVAGAWALMRGKSGNLSVDDVWSRLWNSGVPVTDSRNGLTHPRIQVDAALGISNFVAVTASATSTELTAGGSPSFGLKIRKVGYTGPVNLVVESPPGVTASVTPASPTGTSATLTVQTQVATSSLGRKTVLVKPAPISGVEEVADSVVLDVRPPASSVTGFSPTSGPAGKQVKITGTNLIGSTSVRFNGVAAANVTQVSNAELRATVPLGATTGPIQVTVNDVTRTLGTFTVTQEPLITDIDPSAGVVGDPITLSGFNFTGATSVKFGATNATFVVASDRITTTVPNGVNTGPTFVSVTTPKGTASRGFTVQSPTAPPLISSFSPTQGDAGTVITIKGQGFAKIIISVDVGEGRATSVTRVSSRELQVTVPGNATTGKVKITTGYGIATSTATFTRVLQ